MASLTVLMPVYNAIAYLEESIQSVLAQDMSDFHLLVMADGSTDGSQEYVQGLQDPRITVSVAKEKAGLGSALSRGLALCESEFFVRMDADDIIHPSKFRLQLEFLRRNPDIGLVGTRFHYFGSPGSAVLTPLLPLDHRSIVAGLHKMTLTLVHGSLMGRTDVLKKAGGYRVRGMGEDWDMFLRVSEISRLANLPHDLYSWRLHGGNAKVKHLMEQQLGIEFACDSAQRRASCQAERSFNEFLSFHERKSRIIRWLKYADVYALAQYRVALTSVSNGNVMSGYCRLVFAAMCSPTRSMDRLRRMLRRVAKPS